MNSSPDALTMFESEAYGLKLLKDTGSINIPEVLFCSKVDKVAFLLLNFIEQGLKNTDFWKTFGFQLAALHKTSNDSFGLDSNNYIGSLPQQNNQADNWIDFYIKERLQPQIDLAVKLSALDSTTIAKFEKLYKKLPDIFPTEPPALIHGDLWNGNFLINTKNQPVLIDPSVSFAHREMDLAMSQLFGGFDTLFYMSYDEAFPVEKGFDQRVEIYQLYYLMVHVNLFGGGYLSSVKNILSRYVD